MSGMTSCGLGMTSFGLEAFSTKPGGRMRSSSMPTPPPLAQMATSGGGGGGDSGGDFGGGDGGRVPMMHVINETSARGDEDAPRPGELEVPDTSFGPRSPAMERAVSALTDAAWSLHRVASASASSDDSGAGAGAEAGRLALGDEGTPAAAEDAEDAEEEEEEEDAGLASLLETANQLEVAAEATRQAIAEVKTRSPRSSKAASPRDSAESLPQSSLQR